MLSGETSKLAEKENRNTDLYFAIKNRLDVIEHDKFKGAIIRAKAKYYTEREMSTTYFLSLEKLK